jgi:hypothetical protein
MNIRAAIYIAVASALYFALKRIAGDWSRDASTPPNVFLMVSIAVALTLGSVVNKSIDKFGAERPGAFFERSEYEARLYVHLYPDAQKVISYRVPAMITASTRVETDQDEHLYSWREYWLWSAFMPKGVDIDFHDCRVKLQETVRCLDTNGRRWGVVLTPTPAIGPVGESDSQP